MVNEWIRFADAKAGATLAFTAAMGTMLYNVVTGVTTRNFCWDVSVVAACGLLFTAALLAGLAIAPRTKDKDAIPDTMNNLFFASIAKTYKGRRADYRDEIKRLSGDNEALLVELADQIHANAQIATQKTKTAKWAIRSALFAGLALVAVTIQAALL